MIIDGVVEQVLDKAFSNVGTTCGRQVSLLVNTMNVDPEGHRNLGFAFFNDACKPVWLVVIISPRPDNIPDGIQEDRGAVRFQSIHGVTGEQILEGVAFHSTAIGVVEYSVCVLESWYRVLEETGFNAFNVIFPGFGGCY